MLPGLWTAGSPPPSVCLEALRSTGARGAGDTPQLWPGPCEHTHTHTTRVPAGSHHHFGAARVTESLLKHTQCCLVFRLSQGNSQQTLN